MIVSKLAAMLGNSSDIRVRFAPSPTGEMHVGNMRTAIFNYLFAKSQGGKFLLRIEDTDFQRSQKTFQDSLMEKLKWMGLNHDEEIVYQSANINEHKAVAHELLTKGYCYYCICAAKSDDPDYQSHCDCKSKSLTEGAIRFHIKEDSEFKDFIMGNCQSKAKDIQDFIILRSNGTPTFNLSVVCDDNKMNITHIIRGNDHLSNTFKQVAIYKAMNWKVPLLAHLPLIVNESGKKLSKREKDISIDNYKNNGILPETILSFLVRLGWSYKDQEIFTMEELLQKFPQGKFQKSSACFNESKLFFQNKYFINQRSLSSLLQEMATNSKLPLVINDLILKGCQLIKSRCATLKQLQDNMKIFIPEEFKISQQPMAWESHSIEALSHVLHYVKEKETLNSGEDYKIIYNELNSFMEAKGFAPKDYQQILRYAITNEKVGANIIEIMILLPKDVLLERMENFLQFIR